MRSSGGIDRLRRRQFLAVMAGGAGGAALAACTGDGADDGGAAPTTTAGGADAASAEEVLAAPGSPGLVDEGAYQDRIDEYLASAAADVDPSDLTSIVAALIAAHRDPDYEWDASSVTVATLQDRWDQIDEWQDTRDFAFNYMLWILALADGSTPTTTIDPAVIDAIDQRLVDTRYRYDDPLPDGRVDDQWFWSENHLIILNVVEYLAGQRMPERTFTITGLTGAEHMERTRQRILDWVEERVRFGFFEWHSTTYMRKNIEPLATLIQFADDPELVQAAAIGLDLCLLDVAAHCHEGEYTASQGRNYGFGGADGPDGNTALTRVVFGDGDLPFAGAVAAVNHVAGATRYRPPQVLVDIARAEEPGVTAERHGIFVDGSAPVTEDVEAPFGYDFDDPENLEFWWSQGAVGMWQTARVSLAEAEKYRLFESDLLAEVRALVALNGGDPERIRTWLQENHDAVNFGQLREANTYTWRGEHVALGSVLDHRFGQRSGQIRAWEATIEPGVRVFTQHPAEPAPPDGSSDDGRPGYWTGEASMPRSAQHERTSVHIYQPAWDATNVDPILWSVFAYQDETHAFVPQERFDEVVRDGPWTFLRKGDGYIALWSWREVDWREHGTTPETDHGLTRPFDLVAAGGADNVWICEVGDSEESGTFEDFATACRDGDPQVARDDTGFTVSWRSPSAGPVSFGSTAAFVVDGEEPEQADFPRHRSRWGTVGRLDSTVELRSDAATLVLDAEAARRDVGAP